MASKVDMSLDDIMRKKKFSGLKNGGGVIRKFKPSIQNGGAKPVSDLRSVLAKKQQANITDLRTKLKPKALYTKKFASKSQQPIQLQGTNNRHQGQGRKQLKLTPSFKSSISSAITASSGSSSRSSRGSGSRRSDPGPITHQRSKSSSKLPSYEEAKKISVTVPGLSRPLSEYSSQHREERLAAQIARSKEMRQDSYMRGREEFLASAITSASTGGGSGFVVGGSGTERERDRGHSAGMFGRIMRGYPSRSPSPPPPLPDFTGPYEPLYSLGSIQHTKIPPPPPYSTSRQRGITTATSMFISNLSDTVSKNDVAELCSVVGSLDGVYMHAPGIAEVVFKYKDDALEAFKKYNQRNLDGQPMHCKLQPASRSRLTTTSYGHSYADEFYPHTSGLY